MPPRPAARPVSRAAQMLIDGQLTRATGAGTRRFTALGLDVELLDAVDRALAKRIPLAVVITHRTGPAPVVLAATAVIRAVLNRGQTNPRIGVASRNLTERGLYDQLAVTGRLLATLAPRARITAGGVTTVIGAAKASDRGDTGVGSGRVYLTADAERLLPLLDTLETIIVTDGAVDTDTMTALLANTRRGAPLLYLTSDLYDPHLEATRAANGVVWGFDATSLTGLAADRTPAAGPRTDPLPTLLATSSSLAAAGTSTVTVTVPAAATVTTTGTSRDRVKDGATSPVSELAALGIDTRTTTDNDHATATQRAGGGSSRPASPISLDAALAALRAAIGALGAAAGPDPVALGGVRWAWAVHNTLTLTPTRPADVDRITAANPYALSLTTAAAIAGRYATASTTRLREPWARAAAALTATLAAADTAPRLPGLLAAVIDAATHGRTLQIVVANRAAALALRNAIRESPTTPLGWNTHVTITGIAALSRTAAGDPVDELLIPGALPRNRAGLLATPPARDITLATCGPLEGARAERQAVAARTIAAALRRETVTVSAPELGVTVGSTSLDENPEDAIVVIDAGVERGPVPLEVDAELWEPFAADVVAILTSVRDGEPAATAGDAHANGEPTTAVITVYLNETGTGELTALLCKPNDVVTVRRGSELRRVAAKGLTEGDVVALVDKGARADLRDSIADALSQQPQYTALTAMIDLWHDRAALAGQTCGLTYREILNRMGGTKITHPGTIGTWINHTVDGPADPEDLTRFARAVDDQTLGEYAQAVGWALRTMHSVDRKLGYWLARRVEAVTARTAGNSGTASTIDGLVDIQLGVHVADLLDTVTDHTVVSVDLRPDRYAPLRVAGLTLPARQADDLVVETTRTTQTSSETPST